MEKTNIIDVLKNQIAELKEQVGKLTPKKENEREKPDEEVCQICGGDLLWVDEGIVHCPKCKEYFELTEEENND